ncbi:MAG: hypothetical protein JJE01_16470 [Gemmatimonadetes bacterium]|nr:hypothetical protein [Gemmatimonadota bacterium]
MSKARERWERCIEDSYAHLRSVGLDPETLGEPGEMLAWLYETTDDKPARALLEAECRAARAMELEEAGG